MLAHFRIQWDNLRAALLSKLFLQEWETPLPRNNGACFRDVYLNADWAKAAKKPENNCYIRVDYPFYYESILQEHPRFEFGGVQSTASPCSGIPLLQE